MKIFIDDSGSFGWNPRGVSIFCATVIAGSALADAKVNFEKWKERVGLSNGLEKKGKNLSAADQVRFVLSVVHRSKDFWLIVVGADSRLFTRDHAGAFKNYASEVAFAAGKSAERAGRTRVASEYAELGGWIRNRSVENYSSLLTLVEVIWQAVQHSIVQYADVEKSAEFTDVGIVIDRSFIKERDGVRHWREWLRNGLHDRSRKEPLVTPSWWPNEHPFNRKYRTSDGRLDMADLFRNHMHFADSKQEIGLQMADVCANISFRFFSRPKYRPYRLIRHRILHKRNHKEYTLLALGQLPVDSPEAHVHILPFEQFYPGLEDIIVEHRPVGSSCERISIRAQWEVSGESIECDDPTCYSRFSTRGHFDLRPEIKKILESGASVSEIVVKCDGRIGKHKRAEPCANSRRFRIAIVKSAAPTP